MVNNSADTTKLVRGNILIDLNNKVRFTRRDGNHGIQLPTLSFLK